jgi:hypothetical protein
LPVPRPVVPPRPFVRQAPVLATIHDVDSGEDRNARVTYPDPDPPVEYDINYNAPPAYSSGPDHARQSFSAAAGVAATMDEPPHPARRTGDPWGSSYRPSSSTQGAGAGIGRPQSGSFVSTGGRTGGTTAAGNAARPLAPRPVVTARVADDSDQPFKKFSKNNENKVNVSLLVE